MTGLRNECYSSEGWGYDFTMNALGVDIVCSVCVDPAGNHAHGDDV
jgi:hypothetical protein